MNKLTSEQMQAVAWTLSLGSVTVAFIAWAQTYGWVFTSLSIYQIFPIFGLTAFSLMWSHYISSALRQYFGLGSAVLKRYFEATSVAVLIAILLHPALLEWKLWHDGFGFPPFSARAYVGASAFWAIWLALTAWTIFMAYEFRRVFGHKKWWPLVQYASDAAMFFIFIHALRLGGALKINWFRGVWFFYGASLLISLIYTYSLKRKVAKKH